MVGAKCEVTPWIVAIALNVVVMEAVVFNTPANQSGVHFFSSCVVKIATASISQEI